MTTSAFPSPGPQRVTYARARLRLGISGVGTAVLAATTLLALDVPSRLLSTSADEPLLQAIAALLQVMALGLLLFIPFDVMGGAVVVRERPTAASFLARWLRGASVQLLVWAVVAAVLMATARSAGAAAAVMAFVAVQLVLAALRAPLSRGIAAFETIEPPARLHELSLKAGIAPERIRLLHTTDEGYVGGWSGIAPGQLLLPARWLELPEAQLVATLERRRLIAESGAHLRGVLGAVLWNTIGFVLVLALTGADLRVAAGLLTVAGGMTLWAFVGVLVLPTPSRAAVFHVDALTAREGDGAALREAIERLDRWQDDEARRSVGVETIFHPVPSRSARLERLRETPAAADAPWAAHHLARHALWLGWGTLSPLSRLVHCNVGRPALWAMLPGD